jgi:trehalose-phosphatase
MQMLKPEAELRRFFARVRAASRRVLMLDYDGTLAPFRIQREQAVPYPGVRERLAALMAAGHTRVVLVSGRMAREVAALVALTPSPEVWGTHGWERLYSDGRYELAALPDDAVAGLEEAAGAARDAAGVDAAGRLERKPASLAWHLRGLAPDEAAGALAGLLPRWEAIAARRGLELHDFDGGVELRVPGRSKGTAVAQVLAESGPDVACAYLGDDRTDEDAFVAIAPHGLGVLVRSEPRETAAVGWLRPPEELLEFLDDWSAACRDDP